MIIKKLTAVEKGRKIELNWLVGFNNRESILKE